MLVCQKCDKLSKYSNWHIKRHNLRALLLMCSAVRKVRMRTLHRATFWNHMTHWALCLLQNGTTRRSLQGSYSMRVVGFLSGGAVSHTGDYAKPMTDSWKLIKWTRLRQVVQTGSELLIRVKFVCIVCYHCALLSCKCSGSCYRPALYTDETQNQERRRKRVVIPLLWGDRRAHFWF